MKKVWLEFGIWVLAIAVLNVTFVLTDDYEMCYFSDIMVMLAALCYSIIEVSTRR